MVRDEETVVSEGARVWTICLWSDGEFEDGKQDSRRTRSRISISSYSPPGEVRMEFARCRMMKVTREILNGRWSECTKQNVV